MRNYDVKILDRLEKPKCTCANKNCLGNKNVYDNCLKCKYYLKHYFFCNFLSPTITEKNHFLKKEICIVLKNSETVR